MPVFAHRGMDWTWYYTFCALIVAVLRFVDAEGSVKVLSTAKDNWVPQSREPEEAKRSTEGLETKIVSRREEDVSLDDGRASQAAWIRQYMERQEEVLMYEQITGFELLRFNALCRVLPVSYSYVFWLSAVRLS